MSQWAEVLGACPWGTGSLAKPLLAQQSQPCSTHLQLQEGPGNMTVVSESFTRSAVAGNQTRERPSCFYENLPMFIRFVPDVLQCDPSHLSALICCYMETYHDRGFTWSLYLQNIVSNTWFLIISGHPWLPGLKFVVYKRKTIPRRASHRWGSSDCHCSVSQEQT